MRVVVKHVKAGAGGREQHGVAAARLRGGQADSFRHSRGIEQRHLAIVQRGADQRRVAPDQHHGAGVARHRRGQQRKILALADAAQNQHQLALGAQTGQRGGGGADVGAFAVVKVFDAVEQRDQLDAVRLAPVLAQAVQHRRERAASGGGQRKRRQRVGGVVAAPDAQRFERHQALDVQRCFLGLAALEAVISLHRAHQPGHAVDGFNAVVTGALGFAAAKRQVAARWLAFGGRGQGGHHQRVVAVQQHQAVAAIDIGFGGAVGAQGFVPVQVVLRDVQHRGDCRLEIRDAVELKTGQLQHPDIGQRRNAIAPALALRGVELFAQSVQQRRADIAGHCHGFSGALDQLAGQRGDGGFAVGAGDGNHLGRVALGVFQVKQCVGKQAQLVAAGNAARLRRANHARHRRGREAGTFQNQVKRGLIQQRRIHAGSDKLRARHLGAQARQLRRRAAGVGHRHLRARAGAPARQRQAGGAQAQNQDVFLRQIVHRSFRVDRPTRHSSIVMIQKRTTTWVSFQPDFSK